MIVAVSSIRNEEAIIEKSITHTLGAGADHVIVSDGQSTDKTREIIAELDNVTAVSQDGPFSQPVEMMRLAELAWGLGADWVVPFDADEFWTDLEPLRDLPGMVTKVFAQVFGHASWDLRHREPRRLPKVCFRDAVSVEWGQHNCTTVRGEVRDGFEIRELQYQSYEHFLEKIEKSRHLFATSSFHEGHGSHMRTLVAASPGERDAEWARLCAIPTVHDPIPYRGAR